MTYTLTRISPVRAALVGALVYACISLIFVPVFLLFGIFGDEGLAFGAIMAIMFPLLYAVIGFVTIAIMCVLYNVIVKYTGGIELDLSTEEPDDAWQSPEESWPPLE